MRLPSRNPLLHEYNVARRNVRDPGSDYLLGSGFLALTTRWFVSGPANTHVPIGDHPGR